MTSMRDMISAFNKHANKHIEGQTLNPFSGGFEQGRCPSPRPGQEDYGKPLAGSKTEERGIRAKNHIFREVLELCIFIHDMGTYQMRQRKNDPDYDEEDLADETIVVSFGDLFEVYSRINDKLVGLLIAAKKKKLVYFEPEILFQRRDDDVLIALTKPIDEIKAYIKEQLAPSTPPSPVPIVDRSQTLS